MTIKTAYQQMTEAIEPVFGTQEAKSLARIAFEDAFRLYPPWSERAFPAVYQDQYAALTRRLRQAEPLQYILGQADFYGLKLKVSPAVLIPRQETEELVYLILQQHGATPLKILDIGTGSGCIPLALQRARPTWETEGLDLSVEALEMAKTNANTLQLSTRFFQADILQNLEDQAEQFQGVRWDIWVSNPPYIPHKEASLMPSWVKDYEPKMALFTDDAAPLVFYERIAILGLKYLKPGGHLYFECNEFNAEKVAAILKNKGYQSVCLHRDMQGKNRMLYGQRQTL